MIVYDATQWGGLALLRHRMGSALYSKRTFPPALLAGIVTLILSYDRNAQEWLQEHILQPTALFSALTFVVGLVVVTRAQMSFERFWKAQEAYFRMASRYYDAAVYIESFIPDRSKEHREVQRTLIRWIRLAHDLALEDLQGIGFLCTTFNQHDILVNQLEKRLLSDERKRTLRVMAWVIMALTEYRDKLVVGDPILTRVYQVISEGNESFNIARRVAETPFPFPWAQLTVSMVYVWATLSPVVWATFFPETYVYSFLVALCATWSLFAINEAATCLESPFDESENSLPLLYYSMLFTEDLSSVEFSDRPDLIRKARSSARAKELAAANNKQQQQQQQQQNTPAETSEETSPASAIPKAGSSSAIPKPMGIIPDEDLQSEAEADREKQREKGKEKGKQKEKSKDKGKGKEEKASNRPSWDRRTQTTTRSSVFDLFEIPEDASHEPKEQRSPVIAKDEGTETGTGTETDSETETEIQTQTPISRKSPITTHVNALPTVHETQSDDSELSDTKESAPTQTHGVSTDASADVNRPIYRLQRAVSSPYTPSQGAIASDFRVPEHENSKENGHESASQEEGEEEEEEQGSGTLDSVSSKRRKNQGKRVVDTAELENKFGFEDPRGKIMRLDPMFWRGKKVGSKPGDERYGAWGLRPVHIGKSAESGDAFELAKRQYRSSWSSGQGSPSLRGSKFNTASLTPGGTTSSGEHQSYHYSPELSAANKSGVVASQLQNFEITDDRAALRDGNLQMTLVGSTGQLERDLRDRASVNDHSGSGSIDNDSDYNAASRNKKNPGPLKKHFSGSHSTLDAHSYYNTLAGADAYGMKSLLDWERSQLRKNVRDDVYEDLLRKREFKKLIRRNRRREVLKEGQSERENGMDRACTRGGGERESVSQIERERTASSNGQQVDESPRETQHVHEGHEGHEVQDDQTAQDLSAFRTTSSANANGREGGRFSGVRSIFTHLQEKFSAGNTQAEGSRDGGNGSNGSNGGNTGYGISTLHSTRSTRALNRFKPGDNPTELRARGEFMRFF